MNIKYREHLFLIMQALYFNKNRRHQLFSICNCRKTVFMNLGSFSNVGKLKTGRL